MSDRCNTDPKKLVDYLVRSKAYSYVEISRRALPTRIGRHQNEQRGLLEPDQDSPPDYHEKDPTMCKANGLKYFSWPEMTSRVIAAAFGGYALTYAATACF
jgi:hypothetical protein